MAVIRALVAAGADTNAANLDGATPLHRAERTRCAAAVEGLLLLGADASLRDRSGSTAREMAARATGRSGVGSAEAKQRKILRLLASR